MCGNSEILMPTTKMQKLEPLSCISQQGWKRWDRKAWYVKTVFNSIRLGEKGTMPWPILCYRKSPVFMHMPMAKRSYSDDLAAENDNYSISSLAPCDVRALSVLADMLPILRSAHFCRPSCWKSARQSSNNTSRKAPMHQLPKMQLVGYNKRLRLQSGWMMLRPQAWPNWKFVMPFLHN